MSRDSFQHRPLSLGCEAYNWPKYCGERWNNYCETEQQSAKHSKEEDCLIVAVLVALPLYRTALTSDLLNACAMGIFLRE